MSPRLRRRRLTSARPSRASLVLKPVAGLVSIALIAGISTVLIRLGDGDFAANYNLTASFRQASAGLHPGSQIEEQGVQIGSVGPIVLHHGRALITLGIGDQYKIPTDATATIEPENLFGADQVAITVPSGHPGSSYLRPGGTIAHTAVLDELGQLFSAADPLLSKIDTTDLATSVDELAAAYGGEGKEIASSLRAGTALSAMLARTTTAQLAALDALTRFSVAVEGEGPTFNTLADDGNQTMPLFNAAEKSYATLLSELGTFSDHFAALLTDYRPQVDTILGDGDNVLRVLLSQRQNVVQLIQGLAVYAYRFGHGASSATLPDGSKFAYFKTFILWSDVESFVCNLIAPAKSGLSFLKPLQKAILSGNTLLDCSSELSAFDAAQAGSSTPSSSGSSPSSSSSSTAGSSGSSSVTKAAKKAAKAIYGALGAPEKQTSTSIGTYVDSLLPVATGALP